MGRASACELEVKRSRPQWSFTWLPKSRKQCVLVSPWWKSFLLSPLHFMQNLFVCWCVTLSNVWVKPHSQLSRPEVCWEDFGPGRSTPQYTLLVLIAIVNSDARDVKPGVLWKPGIGTHSGYRLGLSSTILATSTAFGSGSPLSRIWSWPLEEVGG